MLPVHSIALSRFIETTLIVLGSGLVVALPELQTQISACAPTAAGVLPPGIASGCHVNWLTVGVPFAIALTSGGTNALTAWLSAAHKNTVAATVVANAAAASETPVIPVVTVAP